MTSLADCFLGAALARFHARYPNIEVKREEATAQMNVAGVISGRLDIAFVAGVPEPEGCRVETLPEQQIYVAMADQHPFANRPYVTWGALRDELFVVTADGYGPEVEGMLSRKDRKSTRLNSSH